MTFNRLHYDLIISERHVASSNKILLDFFHKTVKLNFSLLPAPSIINEIIINIVCVLYQQERERERQRQTDRQTGRQIDMQTDRQVGRQRRAGRQTGRRADR